MHIGDFAKPVQLRGDALHEGRRIRSEVHPSRLLPSDSSEQDDLLEDRVVCSLPVCGQDGWRGRHGEQGQVRTPVRPRSSEGHVLAQSKGPRSERTYQLRAFEPRLLLRLEEGKMGHRQPYELGVVRGPNNGSDDSQQLRVDP